MSNRPISLPALSERPEGAALYRQPYQQYQYGYEPARAETSIDPVLREITPEPEGPQEVNNEVAEIPSHDPYAAYAFKYVHPPTANYQNWNVSGPARYSAHVAHGGNSSNSTHTTSQYFVSNNYHINPSVLTNVHDSNMSNYTMANYPTLSPTSPNAAISGVSGIQALSSLPGISGFQSGLPSYLTDHAQHPTAHSGQVSAPITPPSIYTNNSYPHSHYNSHPNPHPNSHPNPQHNFYHNSHHNHSTLALPKHLFDYTAILYLDDLVHAQNHIARDFDLIQFDSDQTREVFLKRCGNPYTNLAVGSPIPESEYCAQANPGRGGRLTVYEPLWKSLISTKLLEANFSKGRPCKMRPCSEPGVSKVDTHGQCRYCGEFLVMRNHSYSSHMYSKHGISATTNNVLPLPARISSVESKRGGIKLQGYCSICQCNIDLNERAKENEWITWFYHQQAHNVERK